MDTGHEPEIMRTVNCKPELQSSADNVFTVMNTSMGFLWEKIVILIPNSAQDEVLALMFLIDEIQLEPSFKGGSNRKI
mgnify:CR=1 FL=1